MYGANAVLLAARRNKTHSIADKDSRSRKSPSQGTSLSNLSLQELQELNAVVHPQTVSSSLPVVLPVEPVPAITVSVNDVIFRNRYNFEHGTQTLLSIPVVATPSHSSDSDSDESMFEVESVNDLDSAEIKPTPEQLSDTHPSVKPVKTVRFANPIETVRYIEADPAPRNNTYIKAFKIGAFIVLGVVVIGAAGACIYFFAPAAATAFVAAKLIAGLALLKTVLALGLSSKSTLPMFLTAISIAGVAAFTGFGVARVISYLCTDKTQAPCCETPQSKDPEAVKDPCHPPKP